MLFSEVYSAYFNAVALILHEATQSGIHEKRITEIIHEKAFAESVVTILPALKNEEWWLLTRSCQTPIKQPPKMPLTILQKSWLKALLSDPRIVLFQADISGLEDVEPLFSHDDIVYFDCYADGDPYSDENYINHFHTILQAITEKRKLKISHSNRRDRRVSGTFIPYKLEYSQKDDKFRLITAGGCHSRTINLARITGCVLLEGYDETECHSPIECECSLTFALTDERNALERVMLHFSDCRKETRRIGEEFTTIHNYIDTQSMILRKGAVSAKKDEKLLIPINMRDGSLICVGKGNPDWNFSAPHGAGRLMSRSAAFKQFTMEQYKDEMNGIYSTCVVPDTLDESPMAYKPIEEIISQIEPTAEIIAKIKPIYNFKSAEGNKRKW